MNRTTFTLIRVWAMVTGLVLAGWYFGELESGAAPNSTIAMLLTAIGGFELFLYAQDHWLRRKGRGHG